MCRLIALQFLLYFPRNVRTLELEIPGDLLPSMRPDYRFEDLRFLHLNRYTHAYRGDFQPTDLEPNFVDNASLTNLVWIFELPRLGTLQPRDSAQLEHSLPMFD